MRSTAIAMRFRKIDRGSIVVRIELSSAESRKTMRRHFGDLKGSRLGKPKQEGLMRLDVSWFDRLASECAV